MTGETDYTIRRAGGEVSGPIPVGGQKDGSRNGSARRAKGKRRSRRRKKEDEPVETAPTEQDEEAPDASGEKGAPEDGHSVDYLA